MTSGSGTCTATVTWAADANYNGATKSQSTTASKIDPTVTFTGAPASAAFGAAFTVASTTNSSATPSYTSDAACSNSGTSYTMTSGTGTCTSTVTWAADANYNGATKSQSTAASKIDPTVAFTGAPASAAFGSSFTVASSTNSSATPSYTSGGACSNSGTSYSMTSGTGTCTSTVTWAADANYNGATKSQSTAATQIAQSITVTQHAPPTAVNGSTFNVAVTGGPSGNPVTIAGSGACSGSGNGSATITMNSGSGDCTVAYNQAGNANYSAAAQVTEATTAQPASQNYTLTGFFAPVDDMPVVNAAKAGQAIPMKWSITLNGAPVSDSTNWWAGLTSYGVSCQDLVSNPTSAVEEYAAGASGLQYLGSGNWQFNWKTLSSYAGTCRIAVVTLKDGTTYKASFKFK